MGGHCLLDFSRPEVPDFDSPVIAARGKLETVDAPTEKGARVK